LERKKAHLLSVDMFWNAEKAHVLNYVLVFESPSRQRDVKSKIIAHDPKFYTSKLGTRVIHSHVFLSRRHTDLANLV
jgi:hypothetical protein